MISFKYRSLVKRIKIKTRQKLDQRMSSWLQGVFTIKNPIIGFKTSESKYYDVDSFYSQREKFYGQQVQIVEANDQLQISFTSDNLNSSSFLRPSQPNTSQLNPKGSSDDEDIRFISQLKGFERSYLNQGKDLNILFDIHNGFRKEVCESWVDINSFANFKVNYYVYLNVKPHKESNFRIYVGRTLLLSVPFTMQYKETIKRAAVRYQKSKTFIERQAKSQNQAKTYQQQIEDEAPSFTTYHLQERLNQQACQEYLQRMQKQKLLRPYEFVKLNDRCEENFTEFYKIFCDGIIDNDYESFKSEILTKVENNLQILLSNVDEMDFSRPISREEQRRNLKKSVHNIEIVKVQNYFEILDGLKEFMEGNQRNQLNKYLLDENQEVFEMFAQYLSRDINRNQLIKNLKDFADMQDASQRPFSRCVPRSTQKSRSAEPPQRNQANVASNPNGNGGQTDSQEPPMFGPSKYSNFSPIKYMSDIDSNYKQAWSRLETKSDFFAPEQYGLLYHYLQKRDDSISNFIQELDWQDDKSLEGLKVWLGDRIKALLAEHFSDRQLTVLEEIKNTPQVNYVYENFRFENDLDTFVEGLKEELSKSIPFMSRALHKKSSDSQLIKNQKKRYGKRRYSDQHQEGQSPKQSEISLYQRTSDSNLRNLIALHKPWSEEFEEMLRYCSFTQEKKEEYLREGFRDGHPSIYVWIRNYLQKKNHVIDVEELRMTLKMKDSESRFLVKLVPILSELLKCLVEEGHITDSVRKWTITEFMEINLSVIGTFELYLESKNQQEFIENLTVIYELGNKDMEFYRTYMKRLEDMFKAIAVGDQITAQIFHLYPKTIQAVCEVYFMTGDTLQLLDTLHTLHTVQVERRKITFATLNFTGNNFNPFEYDDGSQDIAGLNASYLQVFRQFQGENWNNLPMGKLTKGFKIGRYSLLYSKKFPIVAGKLGNRQQFNQLWKDDFANTKVEVQYTDQNKQQTMNFDYMVYEAIVRYLKKINGIDSASPLNVQILESYMEQKSLDPMNEVDHKRVLLLKYIFEYNIDVMLIQEAQYTEWNEILPNKYSFVKNSDSVIIWNRDKLGNQKISLGDIYREQLNFNEDSASVFTDRGYLLVSAHLKADKRHIEQAKQLFETLDVILGDHPMLKIILGTDANHFLSEKHKSKFKIAPINTDHPTTRKKRTFLQEQMHKAGKEVEEVKDHLISNCEISDYEVEDIEGHTQPDLFIPNRKHHPFDHFIVRGTIGIPPKTTFDHGIFEAKVATLNFSGINLSPFEYDDGSEDMKKINAIFKQTLKEIKGEDFKKFEIGKIDKQFQEERLCLCYGAENIPIIDGKLATREQFSKSWEERYINRPELVAKALNATQEEQKNCCDMDFMIYLTIVKFIYDIKSLSSVKQLNPVVIKDFVKQKLIPKHLYLQQKQKKVERYIIKHEIDVMFIQEGADLQAQWRKGLDKIVHEEDMRHQADHQHHTYDPPIYGIGNNNFAIDSVIIYNRKKFGNPITYFNNLLKKRMSFNNDTDFLVTDKGYLLASVHLKSKKQIYEKQAVEMLKEIKAVKEEFNLRVIIGIDANHFLKESTEGLHIIPTDETIKTTRKKRTYLQAQLSKAGVQDAHVKDHLISSQLITEFHIENVEGEKPSGQMYIPNVRHPYDHYIVRGVIRSKE